MSERITGVLLDDFAKHGHLHEYYDPESRSGVCGPHFWSWNMLAGLMR